MEEKEEKVEVLDETKTDVETEVQETPEVKKENKNSVILMFAVLGGVIFMVLMAAALAFLPSVFGGKANPTNKQKTSHDVKKVYSNYRLSGNSLEDFDLAFLKLENASKNKVYSPLSIKYALAMLNECTAGQTKEQITAVIGDYQSKKYSNNEHMSFANAMFIRNTFKDAIKNEYTTVLADKYNAEVKLDEFKNADNMNKWVSDKTFNLINDMLDSDTVSREDFELINALAIDMKWNNQIQCATGSDVPCKRYNVTYRHEKEKGKEYQFGDYVSEMFSEKDYYALKFNGKENIKSAEVKASFNRYDAVKEIGKDKIKEVVGKAYKEWLDSEEGKSQVEYGYAETDVDKFLEGFIKELDENYGKESESTDFMLYTDDNVKVFAKDLKEYEGTTLQYVGIMPKNEELSKYIEKIEAKDINNIISNLKTMKKENFKDGVVTLVQGYIPMFDYDDELKLMEDLQKLGIKDVFDINKADLSGMLTKDNKEYISSASHKAKIEFSNDGIRAAAVTAMGGAGAAAGGFDYFFEIPIEKIDITFDKPFMYIIRDKATGEVWFTGSVYEPKLK